MEWFTQLSVDSQAGVTCMSVLAIYFVCCTVEHVVTTVWGTKKDDT